MSVGASGRVWIAVAAIVALACATYATSLFAGFVWDDENLILGDTQIRSLANLPEVFSRDFFSYDEEGQKYGYYRPLITISYMLDYAVAGPNPAEFHLANLLWHIAASLLLFVLCRRLLAGSFWGPLFAALLFAAHPVHTESVSWISGRTDVIATVFGLASLLLGMRYLDLVSGARNGKAELHAKPAMGSVALFACALFAKEMSVVVPLVAALYGALHTFGSRLRRAPAAWLLFAGYALALAAYLLLRTRFIGAAAAGGIQPPREILGALVTLPKALALYWGKLVLPLNLDAYLVVPYEDHPFTWLGLAGLGLVAVAGVFVLRFRGREPAACFLVLAFFASLLPLTNIVRITSPLDMGFTMAERFLYLPSVFFFGLVGWGIERALGAGGSSPASPTTRGRGSLRPIAVAVGLLVVAFAARANLRGLDYASSLTFFEKAYAQHPESELVVMSYGIHLRRAGELDAAIELLEKAYLLNAESGMFSRVSFYNNLAVAYAAKGRFDEAVSLLEAAAAHRTNLTSVYKNLGGVYWLRRDCGSAIPYLSLSLDLNPEQGKSRAMRVDCLVQAGEFSRALDDLEILRETSGADPEFHVNLGIVYRGLGQLPEAIDAFRLAMDLGKRDVKTLMLLGTSLAQGGDYAAAVPYLREAHALEPLALEPAGALARALQRKGREEQAREILRELVDRHPRSATAHLMMAQFCVETSELREAAAWLDKARALDPANPQARILEAHLARAAGR
ncbi:MAG: tetratricopeptide repeat protein [Deltaproteobacteria bacterium]|nr:tetratricopeptide repeat protein [Deltaproteobacteria bacterium]